MVDAGKNSSQMSDSGAGDKVQIQIRSVDGSKFTVRTKLGSTVGEFKSLVAQNCDIPANQQRLIYKGRILKDDQTLDSYGLQEEHAIHLARRFLPDASTDATTAATPSPGGPNTTPGVATGVGANESGGLGGSLESLIFPGLDAFEVEFPQFEHFQQQLNQYPNMMTEFLNMPVFQNLMNNPDLIRDTMMNNPHMRDIIDHNPELAHMLNDRGTMQQTLDIARNPELMREMMRNTDRAMNNIESSPEGFNMLRRMYENVQGPLLNATSTANVMAANPFAALFGGQGGGGGGVQDQATIPASTGSDTTTGSAAPNSNPLPNPWSQTPVPNPWSQTGANGSSQRNASTRPNPAWAAASPGIGGMQDPFPSFQLLQNPAANQQVLAFVQSLSSMPGQQQSPQELDQTGGGTGTQNNMGLNLLMNMFAGLGSGSLPVSNTSNVPPEELYATQLTQLQEMGFIDTVANIQALRATSGNVHAAVERLLGNLGQ